MFLFLLQNLTHTHRTQTITSTYNTTNYKRYTMRHNIKQLKSFNFNHFKTGSLYHRTKSFMEKFKAKRSRIVSTSKEWTNISLVWIVEISPSGEGCLSSVSTKFYRKLFDVSTVDKFVIWKLTRLYSWDHMTSDLRGD